MDTTRIDVIIGRNKREKLEAARVAVVGLGGVGSYVAEALARSGVGSIMLADGDVVVSSNVNRQLPALTSTIGQAKAEVMAVRIHDINPLCNVQIRKEMYVPGTFEEYIGEGWDYVADAIDDTPSKADLLKECVVRDIPIISAMVTGFKLDPQQLRLSDLSKTTMCPLARKMRQLLRKEGIVKGIDVVYSLEEPQKAELNATVGSMIFVPASAGLMMASHIVKNIIRGD